MLTEDYNRSSSHLFFVLTRMYSLKNTLFLEEKKLISKDIDTLRLPANTSR